MSLDQQIQQGIQQHASGARFGLNSIPRHVHNNVDSPYTFQPILTYIGSIARSGGVLILPTGWSVKHTGTGSYKVTHNFDSSVIYSVVATPSSFDAEMIQTETSATSPGVINFFTYTVAAGSLSSVDSPFDFIITVVNNRSQTLPTYVTL